LTSDGLQSSNYDSEQVVEIMCNAACQLANGFNFLRLPQRFLCFLSGSEFCF
jgi:hypothetical protein